MADIQDLLPRVFQYAPGVADTVATYALRQAASSFARATYAFTELVSDIPVDPHDPIVVVQTSPENRMVALDRAVVDGRLIWSRSERLMSHLQPHSDYTAAAPGAPAGLILVRPDTLRLVPVPDAPYTIDVYAVVAPRDDQDIIPDDMMDRYADALVAGALNRIVRVPMQPFTSDPTPWAMSWAEAIAMARIDMNRSNSRGGLRVAPVGF